MADHDTDPLSAEERAELEALRAEKAAREEAEKARRDRAELEALRAEKAAAARPATSPAKAPVAAKPTVSASKKAPVAQPADTVHSDMSFAQRMVSSTEADDDDIPGMAPAQKLIIGICLLAVMGFALYIGLGNAGLL